MSSRAGFLSQQLCSHQVPFCSKFFVLFLILRGVFAQCSVPPDIIACNEVVHNSELHAGKCLNEILASADARPAAWYKSGDDLRGQHSLRRYVTVTYGEFTIPYYFTPPQDPPSPLSPPNNPPSLQSRKWLERRRGFGKFHGMVSNDIKHSLPVPLQRGGLKIFLSCSGDLGVSRGFEINQNLYFKAWLSGTLEKVWICIEERKKDHDFSREICYLSFLECLCCVWVQL